MLPKIISFLLALFVSLVILNLLFGFVSFPPIGEILMALAALSLLFFVAGAAPRRRVPAPYYDYRANRH